MAKTCQYVGDSDTASGHSTHEVVHENGVVTCEADATKVLRRKTPLRAADGRMEPDKTPVCHAHAEYLLSDEVPVSWEACGTVMSE